MIRRSGPEPAGTCHHCSGVWCTQSILDRYNPGKRISCTPRDAHVGTRKGYAPCGDRGRTSDGIPDRDVDREFAGHITSSNRGGPHGTTAFRSFIKESTPLSGVESGPE